MNTRHTPGYLIEKINEALCSAFPDKPKLEMMVYRELNINLNEVASGGNLQEIVDKLIQHCQAYNKLDKLIDRALNYNPDNGQLKAIAENFKITTSLVKILRPLESKFINQMQQAYQACCPDGQDKIPSSFDEILKNLDEIYQPTDEEKLIVKFVDYLLLTGNLSKSKAEQLKQWLEKNANKFYNLLVYKQNLNPPAEPKGLKQFSFQVVTVNPRGAIIKGENKQASYFTQNLGNGVDLDMVYIPAGSFLMGSPEGERESLDRERPQHQVTIQPFFLGKYQVTQAQWRAVANLPKIKRDLKPDPSYFPGDNRPVEQVNWYDAVEFCDRLSHHTGTEYRLPSEAEWEYACRAGTTTPFHYGETITTKLANYNGNYTYAEEAEGEYREETTSVGRFPPNGFGLYDMHGNVWEWCGDPYHGNYFGAPTDGSVWSIKFHPFKLSILRGGSWVSYPWFCRSAHRDNNLTRDAIKTNVGFRVARGFG
ncbi:SUMF1/EgtB/PvdO family nonheme iron enzyme [Moorena sp. SIO4G3]|uniref:SUMF1/EgtB/PvdO family nonheme iron enzyme n=1 Tax=Moorena sp. SIO4G3 TaxID=2607821 RepID=UPI0025E6A9C9|nr:SUMF1/EgtB/PvdO family nonheme iron enzyme [Moorena sp. SIO4G3]